MFRAKMHFLKDFRNILLFTKMYLLYTTHLILIVVYAKRKYLLTNVIFFVFNHNFMDKRPRKTE